MAIAPQTAFVTQCPGHDTPQDDADILNGVMAVDLQIAFRFNLKMNPAKLPRYRERSTKLS